MSADTASKFLKGAAQVQAERAARFTTRRLGLPSSSVATTMPSPDATRLPDGSWMKNEDLESIRTKDPDAYKLITGQGYEAYQQSYNEALEATEPFKTGDNQYDLASALKSSKVTKAQLNLLFGEKTIAEFPAQVEQSLDANLKQTRVEAEKINAEINEQLRVRGQKSAFGYTWPDNPTPEESTKLAQAQYAINRDDYVRRLTNQEHIDLDKALAVWEAREDFGQKGMSTRGGTSAGLYYSEFDRARAEGREPDFRRAGEGMGGGVVMVLVTAGQVQEQARATGYNMPLQLATVVAQGLTAQGIISGGGYGKWVRAKMAPAQRDIRPNNGYPPKSKSPKVQRLSRRTPRATPCSTSSKARNTLPRGPRCMSMATGLRGI